MSTHPNTGNLTEITGLRHSNPQDGSSPRIERLGAQAGVTVVRLSFRAGQTMEDHQARFPILVQGQTGSVTFATADRTVTLVAGTAVHVDAGVVHRLEAGEDSVVTLLVLR
ncbi:cupin [Rhodococcus sp. NPDC054953]